MGVYLFIDVYLLLWENIYLLMFVYLSFCRVFLMDKYFVTSGYANLMNSLVYIISAVASPFVGILVDQTGFNLVWCKYVPIHKGNKLTDKKEFTLVSFLIHLCK